MPAGRTLVLTLYWRVLQPVQEDYKVFAHLLDEAGALRGQRDQAPGEDGIPTSGRVVGEVITDEHQIPVASDAPPGDYHIAVGLYEEASGRRLPVFTPQGEPIGDSILLGPIVLP
jgi:hypothetical protein